MAMRHLVILKVCLARRTFVYYYNGPALRVETNWIYHVMYILSRYAGPCESFIHFHTDKTKLVC